MMYIFEIDFKQLMAVGLLLFSIQFVSGNPLDSIPNVKKIEDFIIYEDPVFYASFPSVVKKEDGEIIVAFRRAPERKIYGERNTYHIDPNSYLVYVKSNDNGLTWTKVPQLLYAHPFGGSQDPCLIKLQDGTLLCSSYGWNQLRLNRISDFKYPIGMRKSGETFLGGFLLRSENGGESWEEPIYPPTIPGESRYTPMGKPLPSYNRGALYEGKDGRVFWVVTGKLDSLEANNSTHLLISEDKGRSWNYSSLVAKEDEITFNETSIYETPKGDLVAFMRTANFDDQACIARSTDGGKSFGSWKTMGFQGHPLQATRLPDDRVFLIYGYRHDPYGIRARILNPECTDFETAKEIVIRDDGGGYDIGYPWSVVLDENRVLVVYYFNKNDGTRHIAGSILEIE